MWYIQNKNVYGYIEKVIENGNVFYILYVNGEEYYRHFSIYAVYDFCAMANIQILNNNKEQ